MQHQAPTTIRMAKRLGELCCPVVKIIGLILNIFLIAIFVLVGYFSWNTLGDKISHYVKYDTFSIIAEAFFLFFLFVILRDFKVQHNGQSCNTNHDPNLICQITKSCYYKKYPRISRFATVPCMIKVQMTLPN